MTMEVDNANYPEQALAAMKMRPPNADGAIGVTIRPDMPEWNAWQAYFLGKRMDNRASFMRSRGMSGYMVPCRNPGDFDPLGIAKARQEYAARMHNGEIPKPDTSRKWNEIPYAERVQMADMLKEIGARIDAKMRDAFAPKRMPRPDAREARLKPLEPRLLTDAERASMRRLAGLPETADEEEAAE